MSAVVAGVLMATQSLMNGALAGTIEDPFTSAAWGLGSGLVLISLVAALTPKGRTGAGRLLRGLRGGQVRWYEALGGVAGGCMVMTQGWTVPIAGVALFTLGIIAGQTLAAVVLDSVGWSAGVQRPVTLTRALAAMGTVGGALLFSLSRGIDTATLLLGVIIGVGMATAVQNAANSRLTKDTGSVIAATLANFVTAVVTVAIIGGFRIVSVWPTTVQSLSDVRLWMLGAGVCGVIFISIAAWAIAHTGVLAYLVTVTTSNIGSAFIFDILAASSWTEVVTPIAVAGVTVSITSAVVLAYSRTKTP